MAKKLTDNEIRAQMRAADLRDPISEKKPWWPVSARFDVTAKVLFVHLRAGANVEFPRKLLRELHGVRNADYLTNVEIAGEALRWPDLDVDISIMGLLTDVFGASFFSAASGRIGGSARTKAKAAAARANGAKGGRPRKK